MLSNLTLQHPLQQGAMTVHRDSAFDRFRHCPERHVGGLRYWWHHSVYPLDRRDSGSVVPFFPILT